MSSSHRATTIRPPRSTATREALVITAVVCGCVWVGCATSSDAPDAQSTGGSGATGTGATPGAGGMSAPGGTGAGGAVAPEGGTSATPTGGAATGGAATGGAATGGTATGGRGPGGRGAGGTPTGGTATGGAETGGAATGGAGGGQSQGSPGCGSSSPLQSGEFTIDVDGTERSYVLDVPSSYDTNNPYLLIFGWHWMGGAAADVVSGSIIGGPYYGQKSRSNGTAILVAPEGIDKGWANTNGRDIAFLRAMLEHFNSNLCIDQGRIFSTGFSYGGMMSYAIGCEMADVFRAIAPMSGATYSGCKEANDHPIAMWGAHGKSDDVVPVANGQAARDKFVARNHCQTQTVATDPSPCVAYQGCDDGYPVVWCEFDGGHGPASFGPDAIWKFFSQF
ncbi:MAG: prolyl oligopeptidase family serine peptidase [Polyangiaceae bacterium]|nr:prolyl oligopeptidase family serine peptidase [Polyangiaceae bacterium]